MIRRRRLLQASTALLAAPAIVARANAQSRFDWQQCKGQHIEVNYQLSPRGTVAKANMKKFEELTGISVGFEQIPEQQQRPKVAMEMATGHAQLQRGECRHAYSTPLHTDTAGGRG